MNTNDEISLGSLKTSKSVGRGSTKEKLQMMDTSTYSPTPTTDPTSTTTYTDPGETDTLACKSRNATYDLYS